MSVDSLNFARSSLFGFYLFISLADFGFVATHFSQLCYSFWVRFCSFASLVTWYIVYHFLVFIFVCVCVCAKTTFIVCLHLCRENCLVCDSVLVASYAYAWLNTPTNYIWTFSVKIATFTCNGCPIKQSRAQIMYQIWITLNSAYYLYLAWEHLWHLLMSLFLFSKWTHHHHHHHQHRCWISPVHRSLPYALSSTVKITNFVRSNSVRCIVRMKRRVHRLRKGKRIHWLCDIEHFQHSAFRRNQIRTNWKKWAKKLLNLGLMGVKDLATMFESHAIFCSATMFAAI